MSEKPRVVISSGGVFHAYHTARGAHRAGYLERFLIGIVDRHQGGIPPERMTKLPLPNLLSTAIQQIPHPSSVYLSYALRDTLYDRMASSRLPDCDIFHGWNHMSLRSLRRAKEQGAKVLIERSNAHPTVQRDLLAAEHERFGLRYPKAAERLIPRHLAEYEEADGVVVPSDFVARTFIAQGYPEERIYRVDLGFDAARFSPGPKLDKTFRVMVAGLITLRKGTHYLLEAFKMLNLPDAELLLVGWKAPDSQLFLPAYEGLYRHVPFVPQHDLPAFYHSASVFVLPSIEEGFGMVVYEAAACGLPVIVTENVGAGVRDGRDGFIVPVRDPQAIAEKLLILYKDEARRKEMGASGANYVRAFTWESYYRQMIGHYDRLLV